MQKSAVHFYVRFSAMISVHRFKSHVTFYGENTFRLQNGPSSPRRKVCASSYGEYKHSVEHVFHMCDTKVPIMTLVSSF